MSLYYSLDENHQHGTRVSTVFLGMDHGWGDGERMTLDSFIPSGIAFHVPIMRAIKNHYFLKLFKHNTER